ncbi:MAG: TIR domain-containing protein [Leptospiraceae bacterium]|nr:TIR domain-containing protein [Leptospiraceae bacterium]
MPEEIEERPPKAFISYTWDSEEHKERIRNFSDLLREYGVDCNIDQYEISPPEGWTHWAINQVEESDYVLVVYTENYKNLSDKKIGSIANRDFIWQADLVTNILYQLGNRNEGGKFIPVVFQEKDKECIPVQLSQYTSYNLSEAENPLGFESLYRHILQESNKPQIKLKTKKAYTKVCPYRGLAPFREEDAQYFYGRETFTEKLIHEVYDKTLVSVIGPSGSGKSSVIYAGLIPYLKEKENVVVLKMRPGLEPIMSMAYGIVDGVSNAEGKKLSNEDRDREASELIGEILSGKKTLLGITQKIREKTQRPVLIFVDQFEEILTISHDKQKAKLFLTNILDLAKSHYEIKPSRKTKSTRKTKQSIKDQGDSCKILLTMRIGFLSVALGNPDTAQIFTDNADTESYIKKLIIGPMNSEELTLSIEKPAIETGLNLEKGLSELIVQAIGEEPGNLPLLEFCLLELWKKQEKVDRGIMTISDYEELGGVKGALVKHADEVFESLSDLDKEKARRIFIQLVHPGSIETGTSDTRKITPLNEIGQENFSLLKKLADERLIVANKTKSDVTNIEVIHEALIREWKLLREWMSASRAFRLWQESINGIFRIWKEEQIDGNLLKGNKLLEAVEWLSKKSDEIGEEQKEFIQKSVEYREREAQAKEEAQRKKRLLLGFIAIGSTISAIIGLTLAWFSYTKMREVEINKLKSETLILQKNYENKKDYIQSYFEIVKAGFEGAGLTDKYLQEKLTILSTLYSFVYNLQDPHVYENPNANPYAFAREVLNLTGHNEEVKIIVFSPDGKMVASGADDNKIKLWDVNSGKKIHTFIGHKGLVHDLSFSPDGKTIASSSQDSTVKLWNVVSGKEIQTLKGHSDSINSVSFIPTDGKTIVSASDDSTIILWDVTSGKIIQTLKSRNGIIHNVGFSPDGKTIASGSQDGTIKLWNVASAKKERTFKGHTDGVRSLNFSPDGKTIASGSDDNTIKLWDISTGKEIQTLTGHTEGVFSVNFSPDGATLISGSADLTIKLWDVTSGNEMQTLKGHNGYVNSVSFSPDAKIIASGSDDESVKLWIINQKNQIKTISDHKDSVFSTSFSPNGKILATCSADSTIKLWDVVSGKEIQTLKGHSHVVMSMNFSLDGNTLVTGSADNTIKLWNVKTGKEIKTLLGHRGYVKSVAFSPDSETIASGSLDNMIKLWDVKSGREIHTLRGHRDEVWSISFSPDGETIASGSEDNMIKLWDVKSGREKKTLKGHNGYVMSVSFSPDGKILASSSEDLTIKLWNVYSGEEIKTLLGHSSYVYSVSFSPDGNELISGSGDRTLKLWDLNKGKEIRTFTGHNLAVTSVSFSPNGNMFVSGSDDGTIKLWDLKIDPLLPLACEDLLQQLDHWIDLKNESYPKDEIENAVPTVDNWVSKKFKLHSKDDIQIKEDLKKKCVTTINNQPHPKIGEEYTYLTKARKSSGEEAIVLYNKALEVNPNFLPAKEELSIIYFYQGREREAFALEKQKEYLYLDRARQHWKEANNKKSIQEKVIQDYKTALKINPKLQPAKIELGMVYLQTGNYKEALKFVEDNYMICYQTAQKLLHNSDNSKEKLKLALEYSKKSYESQPKFWENVFLMTQVYMVLGDKTKALKINSDLKELVLNEKELQKEKLTNHEYIDVIKQQRVTEFLKIIEQVEEKILSSSYNKDVASDKQKKVDKLFNTVEMKEISGIEPNENPSPDTPAYYYAIAYKVIHKKKVNKMDLDLAFQACQKSIDLLPDNPYSLNLLVEIYQKKGDFAKAKITNKKAAKLAKETEDKELIRRVEERKF